MRAITIVILAVGAVAIAARPTYAEVIFFNNPDPGEPGHFAWRSDADPSDPSIWLDITRSSTDQEGLATPSSVGQRVVSFAGKNEFVTVSQTFGGASVAFEFYPHGLLTKSLPDGTVVDDQLAFHSSVAHWAEVGPPFLFFSSFDEGVRGYVGVRFTDIDGDHYGWIDVVREGLDLNAFAWAYETEPGVPITIIPAPGTLLALVVGAAVTRRRRRRAVTGVPVPHLPNVVGRAS